jgi:diacylglycerol kinase (ATP)
MERMKRTCVLQPEICYGGLWFELFPQLLTLPFMLSTKLIAMTSFIQSRIKSFANAFAGLFYFFKSQVHGRVHLLATLIIITFGFYFSITATEWCILTICIALVIATEILNTSVEKLADKVSDVYDEKIRKVKDLAAAAVLITAIAAAIIALIIFIPYLAP